MDLITNSEKIWKEFIIFLIKVEKNQSSSWYSSLLGNKSSWTTYKNHRKKRKDCRNEKEELNVSVKRVKE